MTVPALRFPEFSGEWEEKQLDEITDKKISYGIVQAGPHVPEGMPYIKSKDLNGPLILDELERTSDAIAKSYRRSEVRPGDIVFSLRGNIGVSQIVPNTISIANLTQGTARISVKNSVSNTFVYKALQSRKIRKRIFAVMKGSTFQEISLADLRQVRLGAPLLPEQKKIAAFLGVVDAKIAALRDRRAGLEHYKRGLMQALFSQTLRFTKDGGSAFPDWEEKRLGEVAKTTTGDSNREDSTVEGDYTFFDRSVDIRRSARFLFEGEAIIVAGEGSDFIPRYFVGKFDLHQRTYATMDFKNAVGKFVYYWIYYHRRHFLSVSVGSTVPSLRLPMFEKFPLKLPHPDEQAKIAEALSAMDARIAAVGDQVTKLEAFKKGLLQQMFV